jgi:hypothetical protein
LNSGRGIISEIPHLNAVLLNPLYREGNKPYSHLSPIPKIIDPLMEDEKLMAETAQGAWTKRSRAWGRSK